MTGPRRFEPTEREIAMAVAYRAGQTLVEIGAANSGISRQRVEQILKKWFGIRAKDGGQQLRARIRAIKAAARKDEKYLRLKGCTYAQYAELRAMRKPTRAYSMQMKNAGTRGIPWEMSLWQWWTIWQESSHWNQRGRGNGYMMCRKGDVGPYSVDNVFIQRGILNSSQGQDGRRKNNFPMGVREDKRCTNRRFTAHRQVSGKKKHLGYFATPEAAHAAYLAADPFRVAA